MHETLVSSIKQNLEENIMAENKESGLILTTEDKRDGFITEKKYIVIDFSDYNINVITSNALKYKIVEVVELEE